MTERRQPTPKTASSSVLELLIVPVLGYILYLFIAAPIALSVETATAQSLGRAVNSSVTVVHPGAFWNIACEGEMVPVVPGCTPTRCGRYVVDDFASEEEVKALVVIADKAMKYSKAEGGPCIFDVASGAVTYEDSFISAYRAHRTAQEQELTTSGSSDGLPFLGIDERELLASIYGRIEARVREIFGVAGTVRELRLSRPSFFSRMDAALPRTEHDDYTHAHVDREQYGTFCYTGLLYLSTKDLDFQGGDFVWLDEEKKSDGAGGAGGDGGVVEEEGEPHEHDHPATRRKRAKHVLGPRAGRLSLFTSGDENLHRVERVTGGLRRALTVAFSCDGSVDVDGVAEILSLATR